MLYNCISSKHSIFLTLKSQTTLLIIKLSKKSPSWERSSRSSYCLVGRISRQHPGRVVTIHQMAILFGGTYLKATSRKSCHHPSDGHIVWWDVSQGNIQGELSPSIRWPYCLVGRISRQHPGRVVTIHQIAILFGGAYLNATSRESCHHPSDGHIVWWDVSQGNIQGELSPSTRSPYCLVGRISRQHPGRVVTIHQIAILFGGTYLKATSRESCHHPSDRHIVWWDVSQGNIQGELSPSIRSPYCLVGRISRQHPGRVVTIHQIAILFGGAYLKATSRESCHHPPDGHIVWWDVSQGNIQGELSPSMRWPYCLVGRISRQPPERVVTIHQIAILFGGMYLKATSRESCHHP